MLDFMFPVLKPGVQHINAYKNISLTDLTFSYKK